MLIHHSRLSSLMTQTPTLLDYKRILKRRDIIKYEDYGPSLYNLETGEAGEQELLTFLKDYGQKHWIVIRNLWMNHRGEFESDIVLITYHACYVFEVKNYVGHFEYENSLSRINGSNLPNNAISQAERAYIHLTNICRKISPSITTNGALIFIGEHNTVDILTKVSGVKVLSRNELRRYIESIANEEAAYPYPPIDSSKIIAHFENYEIVNPYKIETVREGTLAKVRRGIYCAECFSYDIDTSKLFITCVCLHRERREEAVLRTICEYGVLNFEKESVSLRELLEFMDYQVSGNYLRKILTKYFKMVYKNAHTTYQITNLPYEKFNMLGYPH